MELVHLSPFSRSFITLLLYFAWAGNADSGQEILTDDFRFLTNETVHAYVAPWSTSPPTPSLPPSNYAGHIALNGIDLWYATFGKPLDQVSYTVGDVPVIFLHGGFANSDYWGHQVRFLLEEKEPYAMITVDSRAQGRSSDDLTTLITYDNMADDVLALMDHLGVPKFSVVGWSDGGSLAYSLCMNHSGRIDRAFAFGGLYHFQNNNETMTEAPVTRSYFERTKAEYESYSATPDNWAQFHDRMMHMWDTGPTWTAESFAKIPTLYSNPDAPLVWIVEGDSEEIINRDTGSTIHNWLWGSSLVKLPGVSHFGFLQDPETFNAMLLRWLKTKKLQ